MATGHQREEAFDRWPCQAAVCHGRYSFQVQFMNEVKKKKNASIRSAFRSVSGKLSTKEKSNYKFNEKYIFRKNVMFLRELLIVPIGPSSLSSLVRALLNLETTYPTFM